MTVSIWRYSHWILAIITSLFVLIASVTGIILAVEPISNQLKPYSIDGVSDISIADLTASLNNEFEEVVSVKVDDNRFVKASVFTNEGKSETYYIDPGTGKKVGALIKRAAIYDFATNLHRSLFLKSTGRFLIGLVSFLMILIVITGSILIAKRQGGFRRWFTKVIREDFNQYYHVIVGRYALVPILIIAITGVMLSMDRFEVLPKVEQGQTINEIDDNLELRETSEFEVFRSHQLDELVSLEYPFSEDEEDYFILKLKDAEYQVNQYTGQVIVEGHTSIVKQLVNWSFVLHTGQGTIVWALALLLSCIAILFFMYSGFAMSLKRLKESKQFRNQFHKDEAEYVILVGSESGSTFRFATAVYEAFIGKGFSSFVDSMNNYSAYPSAKHVLIFTSTYGDGDAPVGASKFNARFNSLNQQQEVSYSVVGFGSLIYPEFCKYAIETDERISLNPKFHQLLPVFKINNQSIIEFKDWLYQWNQKSGINLEIKDSRIVRKPQGLKLFTVVSISNLNNDDTFVLQLKAPKTANFQSGDLLAVYPKEDLVERLYSIGKIENQITLSIRKQQFGLASTYLSQLKVGDKLKAKVVTNSDFHLPLESKKVIMISNGTGIAPFLGMINTEAQNIDVHVYWGGRRNESLDVYLPFISKDKIGAFNIAYSKEAGHKYVQDLITHKQHIFKDALEHGGTIMICGSLKMQAGVLDVLKEITSSDLDQSLDYYIDNGQILMDCY